MTIQSDLPATSRQLWYLHILTGEDTRDAKLTREEAGRLIRQAEAAKQEKKLDILLHFKQVYDEAVQLGLVAGNQCHPVPMIVQEHANPVDDSSPVVHTYQPVMDGACGFAWVNIKPATHPFCRWLKTQGHRVDSYYGGISLWISAHGQSYERKAANAGAMAAHLSDCIEGITALPMSRLD